MMNENQAFGAAIQHFLELKSMSREELAHKAGGMKKDTIDKKLNGDTDTRKGTRRRIISGLGVDYVDFRRIENALQNDEDVFEFLAPAGLPEVQDKLENIEKLVGQLSDSLEGISAPVARIILTNFGARLENWSVGEIEEKFLELAKEYKELKAQIRDLSSSDPAVQHQRDQALAHTEKGEFDAAISCLGAARSIDKASRTKLQAAFKARSISEAQTILANAKILGVRLEYTSAADASLSAYTLVSEYSEKMSQAALRATLGFFTDYANDIGEAKSLDDAVHRLKSTVLPRLVEGSSMFREAEHCLADLFFLKGYRRQDNRWLTRAAKTFRSLACQANSEHESEERLQNVLRLGDTHGEMGLNRNSETQLRLGIGLMAQAIDDLERSGFLDAALNGKIRYGTVRSNLALLTGDTGDFRKAQVAYGDSKTAALYLNKPVAAARADWGLAITYIGEAEQTGNIGMFDLAIRACDSATSIITEQKYPIDWSTIVSNRANAKLERGRKENGTASLFQSLSDYDIALKYRTPERHLLGYVKSLGNKAIALRLIGEREGDASMVEESLIQLKRVCKALPKASGYWQEYYSTELNLAQLALKKT
jgi:tetratricopeptide (TPR) repeat protein